MRYCYLLIFNKINEFLYVTLITFYIIVYSMMLPIIALPPLYFQSFGSRFDTQLTPLVLLSI